MNNNEIIHLNEFISYNTSTNKFLIKEYNLKIEEQEFSFDDIPNIKDHKKEEYKNLLNSFKDGESPILYKSTMTKRKSGMVSNGCSKCSNLKKSIEDLLVNKLIKYKYFQLFIVGDNTVKLLNKLLNNKK